MATKSNFTKSPPLLSDTKNYTDWIKLLDLWKIFTSLEPAKQGPAVALTLQGEAQDEILELSTNKLTAADGLNNIIKRLDLIYKKDELVDKFYNLEAFESYKRPARLPIQEFMTEFDKKSHKLKNETLSDDLLAYRLLKAANLQERDEQLVKATVSKLTYREVKDQLKKIFVGRHNIYFRIFQNLFSNVTYCIISLYTIDW